jgi:hypothetical protein
VPIVDDRAVAGVCTMDDPHGDHDLCVVHAVEIRRGATEWV